MIDIPINDEEDITQLRTWLDECGFKNNIDYGYYENKMNSVFLLPYSITFICKNKQMETMLRLKWL